MRKYIPTYQFGWTKTEPFTLPYFTPVVVILAITSLVGIALTNVILQGYESVSINKIDPNVTDDRESYWWGDGRVFGRTAGNCDLYSLQTGDSFRTNQSVFTWSILEALTDNTSPDASSAVYGNNPLGNDCYISEVYGSIDLNQQRIDTKLQMHCTHPFPFWIAATSNWVLIDDQSEDSLIVFRDNRGTPARTQILFVLDGLSFDFLGAISSSFDAAARTGLQKIHLRFWPECFLSGIACNETASSLRLVGSAEVRTGELFGAEQLTDDNLNPSATMGGYLDAFNVTVMNYFNALHQAALFDLGHGTRDLIFTNATAFTSILRVDPSQAGQSRPSWRLGISPTTWVENFLQAVSSGIKGSIELPLSQKVYPAVIFHNYLCPIFRRKPTGTFISSVFIGTFSTFSVLWTIGIGVVATWLEQRRRRTRGSIVDTLEAGGERVLVGAKLDRSQTDYVEIDLSAYPYAHSSGMKNR
ncbi:hypothetical protein BT69DRAFT_1357140 [Atractiella rhizophila]|nr:hypothetical protein BT69DRAFT_1357140 [Atractiella rhizophila]